MTEKDTDPILSRIRKLHAKYDNMPFDERIKELDNLDLKKKTIERTLNEVGEKMLYLETMPDIAEERIRKDELAIELLKKLKQKGEINYKKLTSDYEPKTQNAIAAYLLKLERFGFVSLIPYEKDTLIKLTQRGREF